MATRALSPPTRIDSGHLVAGFSCGNPTMDAWLKQHALANEARASRTYVRDALRALQRRTGVRQRQAAPLRFGEGFRARGRQGIHAFAIARGLRPRCRGPARCGDLAAGLRCGAGYRTIRGRTVLDSLPAQACTPGVAGCEAGHLGRARGHQGGGLQAAVRQLAAAASTSCAMPWPTPARAAGASSRR